MELTTLYQQVAGQSLDSKWSLRDYGIAIYHYLDNIIAKTPGHIFWLDWNNVYLGCNEHQANSMGFISRSSIVGKTNFDLLMAQQAVALNTANNQVMESGKKMLKKF